MPFFFFFLHVSRFRGSECAGVTAPARPAVAHEGSVLTPVSVIYLISFHHKQNCFELAGIVRGRLASLRTDTISSQFDLTKDVYFTRLVYRSRETEILQAVINEETLS